VLVACSYLDTLTRESGALRVIPGSHLIGDSYADTLTTVTSAIRAGEAEGGAGIEGKDVPSVSLEVVKGRGDVCVFVSHGTSKRAIPQPG
jgi:ectoine hydroxylase-related dioxygenase (phytanoyl-CoA dioxygenase family)